jgi:arsenite methyltransferase
MYRKPELPILDILASSTGQLGSNATWLNMHFAATQPEYENLLRSVGYEPGWLIIDLGCGGGHALPLLANVVGPSGRVIGLDLALDNVISARDMIHNCSLPNAKDFFVGSILNMPFHGDAADGIWCANVLMYLTSDELLLALEELKRIVRPGGLIAVKESNLALTIPYPIDPSYYWPVNSALSNYLPGCFRAPGLIHEFKRAGLREVRQQNVLIERRSPFLPEEKSFIAAHMQMCAAIAGTLDLSEAAKFFWSAQREYNSPDCIINSQFLAFYETISLIVATSP